MTGQTTRPVPAPDELSAPYWAAAARHVLAIARCSRCQAYAIPPGQACARCGSTDPDYSWQEVSGAGVVRSWTVIRMSFLPGFDRAGEAHRFVRSGGIDSDDPAALPALSSGGALGNGRMHGVPQMLECYLQLSGRAGERQRATATVGVACQSSPHYGGAVMYTAVPA